MDRLDDIEAFLAIVERGNQTAAARQLGRSLQSINRSLTALERSIGIDLVKRTTRRTNPTDAGLSFYDRVKPAFTQIVEARRQAADRRAEPAGLLRVAAPAMFAPAYVVPAICDIMERYPRIEVTLRVSDAKADVLAPDLDVAVRIGALPDSDLKVRRLGALRVVVFGSRSYFARHGRPRHPGEIARHRCVIRLSDDREETWPFRLDGRIRAVRVKGALRTDSTAAMQRAVACGVGIGLAPMWQISDLIARGEVETVLSEFEAAPIPVHAVTPPAKAAPAKVRLFIDSLATRLKNTRM